MNNSILKKIIAIIVVMLFSLNVASCKYNDSISVQSEESKTQVSLSSKSNSITSNDNSVEPSNTENSSSQLDSSQNNTIEEESKIKAVENFVKTKTDIFQVTETALSANSSTATYANVPVYYLDKSAARANDIFASPTASSSGNGTKNSPYTLMTALAELSAGRTLFLLGGTYQLSNRINFRTNGTRSQFINICAYNGEKVVFDFSSMTLHKDNKGISLYSQYVRMFGIDFKGAGDNGLTVVGSYNIIENCCFYENRDTGLQILGDGTDFSLWPHDNLILNCTSFNNADIEVGNDSATGENADGFACKLQTGNNNTFDGCIAYANIDDGWDNIALEAPNGRVIMVNCVAFYNGYTLDGKREGVSDGNGFKLGYNGMETNHYLENCYAFDNYDNGFTSNGNVGDLTLKNCTAYNNSLKGKGEAFNYNLGQAAYNGSKKHLTNLLSLDSGLAGDKFTGTVKNSVFVVIDDGYYYIETVENIIKSAVVANGIKKAYTLTNMVESTEKITPTANIHTSLRNADGTVNLGNYLKIKSTAEISTIGYNNSKIGADLNRDNYNTIDKVEKQIESIGNVKNSSDVFVKVYTAGMAYLKLSSTDKALVLNSNKLFEAISFYA